MFRTVWKTALSFENIRFAFASTAVYPLGLEKILRQLKIDTSLSTSSDSKAERKTPGSIRGIRRAYKALQAETMNIAVGIGLIIRASEKLGIRTDLLEYENPGLCIALIDEKKRRKRGK